MAGASTTLGTRDAGAGLAILLVEDETDIASSIAGVLSDEGHHVRVEHDGAQGLLRLREADYDLMISDLRLPRVGGLELFDWVQHHAPATAVVLMSAHGTIPEAVQALRRNAVHYLPKPFALDELLDAVEQVAERSVIQAVGSTRPKAARDAVEQRLIGQSRAMTRVKQRLTAMAAADAPVLIHGETGTGKEVVAQAIHAASPRSGGPFVAINCGALPETLMESELFGHEKGAFTGALQRREGSFVAASGGTLFLDEVTEMPPSCQVKLLRALQEGTIRPLGSNRQIQTDVRILAATNGDLRGLLQSGQFREDLFYRLKVLDILLPPLRERQSDLPLLVNHFLTRFAAEGRQLSVSTYAWSLLRRYPFPGNVRELEHAIQHAVILAEGATIEAAHLPDELRGGAPVTEPRQPKLSEALAEFEREFLLQALENEEWNRTRAAKRLGISRKNLWEKIKRHALEPPGTLGDATDVTGR